MKILSVYLFIYLSIYLSIIFYFIILSKTYNLCGQFILGSNYRY